MLNGVTGAAAPVNVEEEQDLKPETVLRPKMEAMHVSDAMKDVRAATSRSAKAITGQILDKP